MLLSTFLKDVNRTITKLLKLVLKQEKCAAYKTTLSFFFFWKKDYTHVKFVFAKLQKIR